MSILCSGDCHVWLFDKAQNVLGSSSLCTCEAHRVAMYGFPQNYNPFGPHATPPTASDLPDVPLVVFKAAQLVRASHLSADGKRAYCERYGKTLVAKWDRWAGFGAWDEVPEGLPADAIKME